MTQYYVLNATLGGNPSISYRLVDANGVLTASSALKKPNAINSAVMEDAATGEKIKLKRRLIEGDTVAQNEIGEIIYRIPHPRILRGVKRCTFPVEDKHGDVIGEIIGAGALPKKSMLRERLEGFESDSLIFKDDSGIIYYSGDFPEGPGDRKRLSFFQALADGIKKYLLVEIATKLPFIQGPTLEFAVFKVNNPQKTTPLVIMLTYLFNEWAKEAADE